MSLVLTEDQMLLKQSAADFVKKESPVARIRHLRDDADPEGFSRDLWKRMAALGWQAILIPEEHGGLGLGYKELVCVLEECGRNLVPEPLLATVALGANAVALGGDANMQARILPRVAEGSLILTCAYQEKGSRYDLSPIATRAEKRGENYVLSGGKCLVLDAHVADEIVVSAEGKAGPSLFLVPKGAAGLDIIRQVPLHLRNCAIVRLDGVEVEASRRIGGEGEGVALLEKVIDRATVALCAEMLGGMQAAFEMTLDYLKTRKQFGVLIGTFQALKHRAAKLFADIELARSAVLGAADALDRGAPDASRAVSVAKVRCSDTAMLVAHEGVQMHGGIGMTDEHDIGFYLKRARGNEITFGDGGFHRDRFARLSEF